MRILGIDPGSRATGYGVVQLEGSRLRRVAGGVIRAGDGPLPTRLVRIFETLQEVIAATRPDGAALESVFAARGVRSALLLSQARGVALLTCGLAGLAAHEYAPSEVKGAVVGYGRASKAQVQQMVQRLLALEAPPPPDEADALAVAICHGHRSRGASARVARELRRPAQRGLGATR